MPLTAFQQFQNVNAPAVSQLASGNLPNFAEILGRVKQQQLSLQEQDTLNKIRQQLLAENAIKNAVQNRASGIFSSAPSAAGVPNSLPALPVDELSQKAINASPETDQLINQNVSPLEVPVRIDQNTVFDPMTQRANQQQVLRQTLLLDQLKKQQESDIQLAREKELQGEKFNRELELEKQRESGKTEVKSLSPGESLYKLNKETGQYDLVTTAPEKSGSKNEKLTEGQINLQLYGDRMKQAESVISDLEKTLNLTGLSPDAVGFLPNVLKSSDRQKLEQAQRNFLNAALRRESGAVISPTEFVEGKKQYFPQFGDSSEVLSQKRLNRQSVISDFLRLGGSKTNQDQSQSSTPQVKPGTIVQQNGRKYRFNGSTYDPL